MNLTEIQEAIPSHFDPQSRVWIYQSSKVLTPESVNLALQRMSDFVHTWTAHGAQVKGVARILFQRFLLLAADESMTQVSGCSTDSSVRMMQHLQQELGVDLFNRTQLAFYQGGEIITLSLSELQAAIDQHLIGPETLFFNHVVGTKEVFLKQWLQPVKKSWLANKFPAIRGAEISS
ncbi:MAG: hypothetical protein ACK5GV_03660 [Bacteroidota bacterium]|jgi:hypothetical protein